jgi:hypothetical protein
VLPEEVVVDVRHARLERVEVPATVVGVWGARSARVGGRASGVGQ